MENSPSPSFEMLDGLVGYDQTGEHHRCRKWLKAWPLPLQFTDQLKVSSLRELDERFNGRELMPEK
jgi:hypothetical protein